MFQNKKFLLSLTVASSIVFICIAYYFQHVMGLQPCFLCIVQRMAIIGIGLGAAIILLSEIKLNFIKYFGYLIYFMSSIVGMGSAMRQVYLQRFPDPYASCGPGYEYILENSSLAKSIPQLFLSTGSCSEVTWSFIGLSMAEWMIPVFIAYIALGLYLLLKKAA